MNNPGATGGKGHLTEISSEGAELMPEAFNSNCHGNYHGAGTYTITNPGGVE